MAHQPHNILIFGATGLIGKYITSAILASGSSFAIVGIFTSSSSAQRKKVSLASYEQKGATIVIGSLQNPAHIPSAYQSYDTIIFALGREAITLQIDLIRLAEESSTIKRFFPSEFSADIEYSSISTTERVH